MTGAPGETPGPGAGLKVLHIAPTPFFSDRGCHVRVRGMIEALARLGIASVLCTYHHGRDVPGIDARRTWAIPGYTRLEAGPAWQKYIADVLLLFLVIRTARRERPDVLHAHLHEGALIGWVARLAFFWRRTPLVFDMQGSLVGELSTFGYFGGSRLVRGAFNAVEGLICRMADHFVCSSAASRDILTTRFGISPERVRVVNDGVDGAVLAGSVEPRAAKRKVGVPEDRPVFVYTGGLGAGKGVEALHHVIGVLGRQAAAHFLIVGYPEAPTRAFVAAHGLEPACTIVGRVPYDALPLYLAAADAALEPKPGGAGEASGKVLNYMGAGLPVVCFEGENNRLFLGDLGFYADPGDMDSLAARAGEVAGDLPAARERGRLAREKVAREFSWDAAGRAVHEVYRELLKGRGSRGRRLRSEGGMETQP